VIEPAALAMSRPPPSGWSTTKAAFDSASKSTGSRSRAAPRQSSGDGSWPIAASITAAKRMSSSMSSVVARRASVPTCRCSRITSSAMAEIRAEIAANVWQVVAEEGQMVAEGDEIVILESMKMEIPVVTETPGVVRELHVEPEQVVQEGDLIAIIDES
jgi:biotin carboxyl carrier protein